MDVCALGNTDIVTAGIAQSRMRSRRCRMGGNQALLGRKPRDQDLDARVAIPTSDYWATPLHDGH